MATLATASLDAAERRTLERFVEVLRDEFGERLDSVWLYGSRARGEPPHEESDVDLIVLVEEASWEDERRAGELKWDAAEVAGANPILFAVYVRDRDWLERRRAIKSFFIQEVDRDKIVLWGRP